MRAIAVFFDSLNTRFLSTYGGEDKLEGFEKLRKRSLVFDSHYVGSMPCMPARRELHTGRYNFMHRCWGPIEPFDDSMPQILKEHGIHTHLVSDHAHYWEDGGGTYHTRYNTWEGFRGQEGDMCKGQVADPTIPEGALGRKKHSWRQEWINRSHVKSAEDSSLYKTFGAGLEFIETNHASDNWFLQIEPFDPHEPYFLPYDEEEEAFDDTYTGPFFDWPNYGPSDQYTPEQITHVRNLYRRLVKRCDRQLKKVLDMMDTYNMWDDTMLIVSTDHGFLLGEHGWMGKNRMPTYNDIAHIPCYVHDPRNASSDGKRAKHLTQTIDIAPTLLDFFQVVIPSSMQGLPLSAKPNNRKGGLFGLHGGHINVTDGRYVYMRAPVDPNDRNLFNYTLMPTHIYSLFTPEELQDMELVEPLSFSKNCKVLKIRALGPSHNTYQHTLGDFLFDLQEDKAQEHNLSASEPEIVSKMQALMVNLMKETDVPQEAYVRYGLQG
ncbi:MAG TPA: sulfatase [Sphaerochaeta sp.]|nr:sulfatase [Sphaerochaeta sp.]